MFMLYPHITLHMPNCNDNEYENNGENNHGKTKTMKIQWSIKLPNKLDTNAKVITLHW
jgi:hypothetical protein